MARTIGTVSFAIRGTDHTLTLRGDRTWDVVPSLFADVAWALTPYLDQLLTTYGGPADGPYGPRQLHNAAFYLRGTVRLEPTRPDPPGAIY